MFFGGSNSSGEGESASSVDGNNLSRDVAVAGDSSQQGDVAVLPSSPVGSQNKEGMSQGVQKKLAGYQQSVKDFWASLDDKVQWVVVIGGGLIIVGVLGLLVSKYRSSADGNKLEGWKKEIGKWSTQVKDPNLDASGATNIFDGGVDLYTRAKQLGLSDELNKLEEDVKAIWKQAYKLRGASSSTNKATQLDKLRDGIVGLFLGDGDKNEELERSKESVHELIKEEKSSLMHWLSSLLTALGEGKEKNNNYLLLLASAQKNSSCFADVIADKLMNLKLSIDNPFPLIRAGKLLVLMKKAGHVPEGLELLISQHEGEGNDDNRNGYEQNQGMDDGEHDNLGEGNESQQSQDEQVVDENEHVEQKKPFSDNNQNGHETGQDNLEEEIKQWHEERKEEHLSSQDAAKLFHQGAEFYNNRKNNLDEEDDLEAGIKAIWKQAYKLLGALSFDGKATQLDKLRDGIVGLFLGDGDKNEELERSKESVHELIKEEKSSLMHWLSSLLTALGEGKEKNNNYLLLLASAQKNSSCFADVIADKLMNLKLSIDNPFPLIRAGKLLVLMKKAGHVPEGLELLISQHEGEGNDDNRNGYEQNQGMDDGEHDNLGEGNESQQSQDEQVVDENEHVEQKKPFSDNNQNGHETGQDNLEEEIKQWHEERKEEHLSSQDAAKLFHQGAEFYNKRKNNLDEEDDLDEEDNLGEEDELEAGIKAIWKQAYELLGSSSLENQATQLKNLRDGIVGLFLGDDPEDNKPLSSGEIALVSLKKLLEHLGDEDEKSNNYLLLLASAGDDDSCVADVIAEKLMNLKLSIDNPFPVDGAGRLLDLMKKAGHVPEGLEQCINEKKEEKQGLIQVLSTHLGDLSKLAGEKELLLGQLDSLKEQKKKKKKEEAIARIKSEMRNTQDKISSNQQALKKLVVLSDDKTVDSKIAEVRNLSDGSQIVQWLAANKEDLGSLLYLSDGKRGMICVGRTIENKTKQWVETGSCDGGNQDNNNKKRESKENDDNHRPLTLGDPSKVIDDCLQLMGKAGYVPNLLKRYKEKEERIKKAADLLIQALEKTKEQRAGKGRVQKNLLAFTAIKKQISTLAECIGSEHTLEKGKKKALKGLRGRKWDILLALLKQGSNCWLLLFQYQKYNEVLIEGILRKHNDTKASMSKDQYDRFSTLAKKIGWRVPPFSGMNGLKTPTVSPPSSPRSVKSRTSSPVRTSGQPGNLANNTGLSVGSDRVTVVDSPTSVYGNIPKPFSLDDKFETPSTNNVNNGLKTPSSPKSNQTTEGTHIISNTALSVDSNDDIIVDSSTPVSEINSENLPEVENIEKSSSVSGTPKKLQQNNLKTENEPTPVPETNRENLSPNSIQTHTLDTGSPVGQSGGTSNNKEESKEKTEPQHEENIAKSSSVSDMPEKLQQNNVKTQNEPTLVSDTEGGKHVSNPQNKSTLGNISDLSDMQPSPEKIIETN